MVMFDNIEEIFQELRDYNECSKALVTLTTAIGALIIIIITFRFFYSIIQGTRLYILSQMSCCQANFIERYGKWVVISGSTDGIGLSMAKEFARRGHSILVIGRNDEKLAKTKELLEREPNVGEVETVKIDLSDSSLENYDRIRQKIDPDNRDIGILVNNAGTFGDKYFRFHNNDMKYLRDIANINMLAPVFLTRMMLPGMLERQKGLILNVSSLFGLHTTPYTNLYCPTKQFINAFTESIQAEYSQHNLDIICLTPGPVNTKLLRKTKAFQTSNIICPESDDYAKSVINSLSTRVDQFSGNMIHGLIGKTQLIAYNLGLVPISMRILCNIFTQSANISPVMKRKVLQSNHNGQQQVMNSQINMDNNQENVPDKPVLT